ncbi:uncharacterized protein LOC130548359 isoform X1 [Triplophysa rosa]|uniref:uncharacterized protein LOC130548359 isoform X1 n=1 Tax=Triplophysa rosa TaxID=992332 RepID=UPI00254613F2|nr:uncharacterized protein LOC130548359 isoform X1 [Triplophysa rosa]
MKNTFTLNIVLALMCGVFGDEVKTVMEGHSVTLHTHLTDMNGVIRIIWRVGEKGSQSFLVTIADSKPSYDDNDVRFRDRLQVNNQTGDLTIKNMRVKHSGLYEAEINKGAEQLKNFSVTVIDSPRVIGAGTGDVKSVSVSEGESVTLHNDLNDKQNGNLILWRFGDEGLLIAKHDQEDNKSSVYDDDEGFRGRLKLDDQTGSLTISDVRSSDSGLYKLKINNNKQTLYKTFSVYVRSLSSGAIAGLCAFLAVIAVCVIAAGVIFYLRMSEVKKLMNEMKSVSVTEGDSVTLHTNVTKLQSDDHVIEWRFGHKNVIAKVNRKDNALFVYDGVLDGIFIGRLKLNDKTGSLTITNINMRHAGLYKVKMSSGEGTSCSRFIARSGHSCSLFNVVVQAQIKSVSVMEGDSVTLPADLTDQHTDAVIEWMFKDEDAVIARFSRKNKDVFTYGDVLEGRFRDRLQVSDQTGDLIITDVNIRHAGVYKLWIIASTGVSFSQFNIIVKERIRLAVLGQSVSLITGVTEIKTDDDVQWAFGPEERFIARINARSAKYELYDCDDVRFRDGLKLNQKTGSVTIANITVKHSGVYQVWISNNIRTKYKKFSVTISVLAKRGESVTLHTESQVQRDSEIQWILDDNTILVTGKNGEDGESRYTDDERFTDRLKMNADTGDLTITHITTEHNGVYKLQQINSDGKIPYRMFSVCVIDSAHGTALNDQKSDLRGISNVTTPLLNAKDV